MPFYSTIGGFIMQEDMEKFIISCLELRKEMLDKEKLTKKESDFLDKLDKLGEMIN